MPGQSQKSGAFDCQPSVLCLGRAGICADYALSTVFDYTNGRLIEYFQNKNRPGKAKVVLVIDLVGNLGILGFFKYADFVIGNINSITGAGLTLLHIATASIGISFYTFQTMSYTIDVYRKVVPAQHNIVAFATYVTLFPQLIAGPIVQYKTVASELSDRKVTLTDFSEGDLSIYYWSGKESASGKPDRKSVGYNFTVTPDVCGDCLVGGNCIQFPDLFRFLGLFRYGNRFGKNVWVPLP